MDQTLRVLGRMIIADTLVSLRSAPQPWSAANDRRKPKKPKNRDKVKAARKQRNRK